MRPYRCRSRGPPRSGASPRLLAPLAFALAALPGAEPAASRVNLQSTQATISKVRERSAAPASVQAPPIFCNRAVNMGHMEAIGFDMDWTLCNYRQTPFDLLAYNGAKERLVGLGYPEAIRAFEYDTSRFQRGLVIDKARGNVLKMDRHKYVKVAHHGLQELPPEARKEAYEGQKHQFTPPDYANIDTAFLLVDVCLFCQLVDYMDRHPGSVDRSYAQVYADVRRAVDLCHSDGVIKDVVMADPASYIERDPMLAATLGRAAKAGKKVFLLTNSLWDYTDAVMEFLLGEEAAALGRRWTDFFDVVIVGARKPAFLLDPQMPIFRVHGEDGSLGNLENAEFAAGPDAVERILEKGKIFQGGNWKHLHKLLGVSATDRLLYVGDHMYSDVLRAKRTLGWRTMLVVPELDKEVRVQEANVDMRTAIHHTRAQLHELEEAADELRRLQLDGAEGTAEAEEVAGELARIAKAREGLKRDLGDQVLAYHRKFHPFWGQLFKTGYQNSRFAQQVEEYACLYTSRATNLAAFSPDARFHTIADVMPHDYA